MRALSMVVALLLSACTFDASGVASPGGGDDASPAAADAAPPGPDAACALDFVDLCALGPPAAALTIRGDEIIDTGSDPRCQVQSPPGGPEICLLWVASAAIAPGASLTAIGPRPLVIASPGEIDLDGLLDVSSRRGGATGAGAATDDCPGGSEAEDDRGGAAGAAGGSFGGTGGAGGTGDSDDSLGNDGTAQAGTPGVLAAAMPSALRGGCPGRRGGDEGGADGGTGGSGGNPGGAVLLRSSKRVRVRVGGAVRATGAGGEGGGVQAGGGGGGSGGVIVLDAPEVEVAGQLSANGGGGGGGGARVGGDPVPGGPGGDGDLGLTPAAGGAPGFDGTGGAGAAGAAAAAAGTSSPVGGGGGGGGAGIVLVRGALKLTGTSSPAPR